MLETATGLVLRTRPLTETSLIVHWLTPDFGRLATVAKGARRPKSPFRGKIDLFYLASFSFTRSKRSELHTMSEINLRETHSRLRQELGYLEQASYCAELIEQTTETDTPLPGVFDLMASLLKHLPSQPPLGQTVFAFELKLLKELGLQPDLLTAGLSPGAKQLVAGLADYDWSLIARLRPSGAQISEINHFLHGYLVYHLGRVPKERARSISSPNG